MALLDNLVVKFTGDSSQLASASKLAIRSIRGVGGAAAKLAKFGALGIGGIGAATGLLIQSSRTSIDQLRKLASNLGFTVRETQQLRLVSELTGTSMEATARASQRLTRFVGDAARGNKNAIDAFDELGLSVRDLQNQSAFERFRSVLQALAAIEDRTKRGSVAATLFEESWQQLNPLIEGAEGAFKRAERTIVRLGTGLGDQSAKIEDFNDNITLLIGLGTAMRDKVFEALSPLLLQLSKDFLRVTERALLMAGGGQALARVWREDIVEAVKATRAFFADLGVVVGAVWSVIRPILNLMRAALGEIADIIGAFQTGGLTGGAEAFAGAVGRSARRAIGLGVDIGGAAVNRIRGADFGEVGRSAIELGRGVSNAFLDELLDKQLTEQQEQTRILRRIGENTFTNVAVAG